MIYEGNTKILEMDKPDGTPRIFFRADARQDRRPRRAYVEQGLGLQG
jgi:hypothetical protein